MLDTPQPAKTSRRALWIALTATITLAVLGGGGYYAWTLNRTTYVDLAGQVVIVDNDPLVAHFLWNEKPTPACHGTEKYADIIKGGSLTIRSDEGETLAVATLEGGVPGGLEPDYSELTGAYVRATECAFPFVARHVPERGFYQLQPGQQPVVMVKAGMELRVMLNG